MRKSPAVHRRPSTSEHDRLPQSLHPVIRRVLLARGVSEESQLELGLQRMESPELLSGMDKAAEILASAITEDRCILIVGDFDADGATGTALAVRALRLFGAKRVRFRVPNRFEFGYGLTPALVETLQDDPPDVLVTVDSGISCIAGVEQARSLGCEVVITDHHLPGESLPNAHAIVNPNSPGDEFPSKSLAGVGVVFYLMGAVRKVLRTKGWFGSKAQPNLANLLDLVALGTVADVVPLDRNNRILVRQGLDRIRAGVASPGLLALLRLGKRDYRHLVASDLGFTVGPRLNAAGRLEDMSVGIRCLLTDNHDEAMELAEELDELNRQRKGMQQQMQLEAQEKVQQTLARLGDELPMGVCLHDEQWHQGIVGLVASRIKDHLYRPVIVFAPENESSNILKGSARSIKGVHVRDVLAHVDALNPGLIRAFGGHAMAAGLSLEAQHFDRFQAAFSGSVEHFLDGKAPSLELLTDGELTKRDMNLDLAHLLRNLGPWGQHFPEPLFEGAFEVLDQRVVGGAHLKMVVRPLDGHEPIDAIAFGKLPEDLPQARNARFVYRLDVNYFRGEESCQLMVEEIVS